VAHAQDAQSQAQGADVLAPVRAGGEAQPSTYKVEKQSSEKATAPLLDTPKSVTIIPKEVIQESASTTLVDALRTVPGITFGAGEGGNPQGDRPFIRGFDIQSSTYVDGMRDLGSQSREVFAIEQIEVTKGSDSTVGGGGSAGGSLNIVTKTPGKENAFTGSITGGTDETKRITVDGNVLLGDNIAFRMNAMWHDADVAGRDALNVSRWGVAPSLKFGLNGPTSLTLSFYHLSTDDLPDTGVPYNNPFNATSPNVSLNGDGQPVGVDRHTFYGLKDRDYRKTQVDIGTAKIEHEFNDSLKLTNTFRYSRTKNDYILTQPDDSKGNFLLYDTVWRRANTRFSHEESVANQTNLSGDFDIGSIKNTFSVGVEFGHDRANRQAWNVVTSSLDPLGSNICQTSGAATNYNCTTLIDPDFNDPWSSIVSLTNRPTFARATNVSVYGFDTVKFDEQWSLNLGLRYDNFKTHQFAPAYPATTYPAGNTLAATTATDQRSKTDFLNYQVGLVFKPVPQGSIYVSTSSSSDPVGLNLGEGSGSQLTDAIEDLQPERSRNYEIGVKWDVFDGALALNGALFRTEKTNARVTMSDGTTQNAGDYRVDGIELGVTGNVTDEWQVTAGYTHLWSKIRDNGTNPTNAAYVGNQFANTPTDSFTLWTTYDITPDLKVGGGAYYMSKVYGNVANTKWVPGYVRFDLMAAYRINEHFDVQLNGQNIGNKVYFDRAYASHFATFAPGRSVLLTLNVRY
jgi:catecholate siderophore receptor